MKIILFIKIIFIALFFIILLSYFLQKIMKNIKRRTKRSYFGYIFTFISILVVFLIIPQILFVKSAKLMNRERGVTDNVPPSANFYIAKNYLDLLAFFPGFTNKSKELVDDVSLFYLEKFNNKIAIKKDSITGALVDKLRLERDSAINYSEVLDKKILINYYDSIEEQIFDTLWINDFNNKNDFCEQWSLFFYKTGLNMDKYSTICE